MDYKQQYTLDWLRNRPLINISKLEKFSGCPKGTIRHFLKERRSLSDNHMESIHRALAPYGFRSMDDE